MEKSTKQDFWKLKEKGSFLSLAVPMFNIRYKKDAENGVRCSESRRAKLQSSYATKLWCFLNLQTKGNQMTQEKFFETDWSKIKEIQYKGEWYKLTGINSELRCVIISGVFILYSEIQGVK